MFVIQIEITSGAYYFGGHLLDPLQIDYIVFTQKTMPHRGSIG